MKKRFDDFLKNGLSEYDATYLNDFKYVMLLSKDNVISTQFANLNYMFFIEYPEDNKEYDTPEMVLKEEMHLCDSDAGIIYENIDELGNFQPIAFIDNEQIKMR